MIPYTVLFEKGFCGTWFIWFINQHQGFDNTLKFTYDNTRSKYDKVDIVIEWDKDNQRHLRLVPNINWNWMNEDWVDYKFNNMKCIRLHPHGCLDSEEYKLFKQTNKFNEFKFVYLWSSDCDWVYRRLSELIYPPRTKFHNIVKYADKLKQDGYNVCSIDITKILKLSNEEYNKLLEYINGKYLKNWKTLVNEYKQKVNIWI